MNESEKDKKTAQHDAQLNRQQQDVDKHPGEESGEVERVTNKDLKRKKVDADPSREEGKPAR